MSRSIQVSLIHINALLTKENMPPLGLMYLAATLKKNGFPDIAVLDLQLEKNQKIALRRYLEKLDRSRQHLFGFYMNTPTRFIVKETIQMVRKSFPDAIICAGGPHPTLDRVATLQNCPGLDFIVVGEGEETILECLRMLEGRFKVDALEGILGMSFETDGQIRHNHPRSRVANLDLMPFPDRGAVPIRDYRFSFPVLDPGLQKKQFPTSFISSRGCPYDCIFCSVADQWGRQTTYLSPERVTEEIEFILKTYGFNALYFFDDTFTLHRRRVIEICELILKKNIRFHWFCEIRANTVDRELLELMFRAGLRSVAMGIESGSPRILKEVVKKGITLEEAEEAVRMCRDLGIFVKTFFSYSYPGEKRSDVQQSLEFARKIHPDSLSMTKLIVYPGTPLFKMAVDQEKLPHDFNWFKHYPYYGSAGNEMVMPNYVDLLSFYDFLAVEKEMLEINRQLRTKRRTLFYMLRVLLRNFIKIKSGRDLKFVLHMIVTYFRNLFRPKKKKSS